MKGGVVAVKSYLSWYNDDDDGVYKEWSHMNILLPKAMPVMQSEAVYDFWDAQVLQVQQWMS